VFKSTQFDLLRHGTPALKGVYLGRTDSVLSAQGAREVLAAVADNPGWDLVVSSPLLRCLDSAQSISEQWGIPLLVLDQLQEYDFGDWDGQAFEAVYAQHAHLADRFWQDPEANPPPNGETVAQFIARVQVAKSLLLNREETRILVITHGGVIRAMIADLLGVQPLQWSRIKVDYACFTQLKFDVDSRHCWPQLVSSNTRSPF
jgi:alpha-ribazole phosphatase